MESWKERSKFHFFHLTYVGKKKMMANRMHTQNRMLFLKLNKKLQKRERFGEFKKKVKSTLRTTNSSVKQKTALMLERWHAILSNDKVARSTLELTERLRFQSCLQNIGKIKKIAVKRKILFGRMRKLWSMTNWWKTLGEICSSERWVFSLERWNKKKNEINALFC